jgi:hypothetical protein
MSPPVSPSKLSTKLKTISGVRRARLASIFLRSPWTGRIEARWPRSASAFLTCSATTSQSAPSRSTSARTVIFMAIG